MSQELTSNVGAVETAEQGIADASQNTSLPKADNAAASNASENTATKNAPANGTESKQKTDQTSDKKNVAESQANDAKEKDKVDKEAADQPIKDWNKIKFDIPENVPIDDTTLNNFGKTAIELGLTEKQAKKLVEFQVAAVAAQREAMIENGVKILRKEWGGKASQHQQAVMTLIANIDRQMGGSGTQFSKALDQCGATCLPDICKGLLLISQAVSEDAMGKGGAGRASEKPESALEALQSEWAKARGRRL